MGKNLTRRNFLRYGAAAAAVPVLSSFASNAYAEENNIVFSEEYDVIVVGSGIAGTTAAIRAAELGNTVLVIEKMPIFGGTSLVSGLNFSCVNSPFQEKLGIKDKPEYYADDMAKTPKDPNSILVEKKQFRKGDILKLRLCDEGGAVVIFKQQ